MRPTSKWKKYTERYSVLKVSEGGPGQLETVRELRAKGFEATGSVSPFVGHTAVLVKCTAKQHRRVSAILYSGGK